MEPDEQLAEMQRRTRRAFVAGIASVLVVTGALWLADLI